MNDPKLLLLSDSLFRAWVTLLCTASQNDGVIPSLEVAAISLRTKPSKAGAIVGALAARGLLDKVEGGYFEPHNWGVRQYKSDVSNDRVKLHRQRKRNAQCNVTATANETPPETETESEIRERGTRAREPLISAEAFDLSDDLLKAMGQDREAPEWYGFPHLVQTWLAEKIPKDFIVSTCASLRGKHRNYLDKAVRNGWRDRQNEPQTPRKVVNGPSHASVVAVSQGLTDRIHAFTGAPPLRIGEGNPDVRLLPKG